MDKLNDLQEKFKETEEFLSIFGKYVEDNFLVPGGNKLKTTRDWRAYFFIKIPEGIEFQSLVELSAELMKKYQEACNYRDQHLSKLTILDQIKKEKYYQAYQDTQEENKRKYNKQLSAESCKAVAMLETKELEDALASQKAIKDFWEKTCTVLVELRKMLEVAGFALSGDARIQRDLVIKGDLR